MGVAETVERLAAPVAATHGCSVYDVVHAGGKVVVSVSRQGGVDLDTLSLITTELSSALDAEDPLPGSYTLEVSSPGLERVLRTPAHFAGAVGEVVTVKVRPQGDEGSRRLKGELLSVADDAIEVRDEESGPATVELGRIDRARTVFEWGPPPKPGPQPQKPAAKKTKTQKPPEEKVRS